MKAGTKSDLAASVRQRLFNLAKVRRADFQLILIQYGIERLLYRLTQSVYKDRFLLKGAMLFSIWSNEPFRSTRGTLICWVRAIAIFQRCSKCLGKSVVLRLKMTDSSFSSTRSRVNRFAMIKNIKEFACGLKRVLPGRAYHFRSTLDSVMQ